MLINLFIYIYIYMNKLILIILLTAILFPPPIEKMRNNIKIILYLIGLICILQKSEGFGNIDAEALQNMASLYNSSTGVLKVNNLEASGYIKATGDVTTTGNIKSDKISTITADGYISTNLVKPTVTNKNLNIKGPSDQTLTLNGNNSKWIDLINTNVHIRGDITPVIPGKEPDKYSFLTSVPTEFRKNITTKGFIQNEPLTEYIAGLKGEINTAGTKINFQAVEKKLKNPLLVNAGLIELMPLSMKLAEEFKNKISNITSDIIYNKIKNKEYTLVGNILTFT